MAVCRLMENLPEPNFEITFYESKVKICYPCDKDIQIEWPDGRKESYMKQTESLDPSHPLCEKWIQFLEDRKEYLKLNEEI